MPAQPPEVCEPCGQHHHLFESGALPEGGDPISGRVHQPAPVHQIFVRQSFVVCSFVPRKLDYNPQSIPVPYHHSNVDGEEVMEYASGNFKNHRGVEVGTHLGAAEASIGKEATEKLAIMMKTCRPFNRTAAAFAYKDEHCPYSWLDEPSRA
jgi:homogentisate 1,2-dioxygenase